MQFSRNAVEAQHSVTLWSGAMHWFEKLTAPPRKVGGSNWFILGDSHTEYLGVAASRGLLYRPAELLGVAGATAVGLRNPNSLTRAMDLFNAALFPRRDGYVPVIHLGEVDCGFVIWWRAQKYGESVDKQMSASVAAYFDLVDRLVGEGYPDVVVTGASPPTIRDGQEWGEVTNLRREVTATLRQRTQLTLRYNAAIRREAMRRKLPFVDPTPLFLDWNTGLLSDKFRHPESWNHHLNPDKAAPIWAAAINRIDRLSP